MDNKTVEKKIKFIEDYKKALNASTGSKYDSNANVTQKNIATLECELTKKDLIDLNRAIMLKYIKKIYDNDCAENYLQDLENHIIYSHDESSLKPYCVSVSLYPFILDGLKLLGGSSGAPKHVGGFIGGLINLIYMVSSQFAGAVAVPETLCYMDHFLRCDYGDDYTEHLDEVAEHIGPRKATLKDKIEDWFQQLVYCINQPAGARNYQSPFTNIAYFDKYYFESIFQDFIFPDGDEPKWETTCLLQKLFMKWFNRERTKEILTFPVETANSLVQDGVYADSEMADFFAEMWGEGHSFFMYQSDSVDALASCCRLRNEVESNIFSYTLGAGGIQTGSKKVITLNINRIIQNWDRDGRKSTISEEISKIVKRVHKYLNAWNEYLWDMYDDNMLPIYKAGFIDLNKQYLTLGINGLLEAAEYLKITPDPYNEEYKNFACEILGTISKLNREAKTEKFHANTEFVPAENLGVKNYLWDKEDGYWVPECRNLYNSYFYAVEDMKIDPVKKFAYQGFASDLLDGGSALHNNLEEHLSKEQYRKLMDVAVKNKCNYFTYNIPNTICNECGNIDKRMLRECPKCGSKNLDYATRIIGYLKRRSNFSEPRQAECDRRYTAKKDEVEKYFAENV